MNTRILPSCYVFIATSLDGFIARENGQIDWLMEANGVAPPNEDCGYKSFYSNVDALIMGRNTFEQVLSFPDWPYGDKPVFVMSRKGLDIPKHIPASVKSTTLSPSDLVESLNQTGLSKYYIDGGKCIQSFMQAGLVKEIIITLIPILLGKGIRLFGEGFGSSDIHLKLLESRSYPFGFAQLRYKVREKKS